MDILNVWDEVNQQWVGIPAMQGDPGVYIGDAEPSGENIKVWIDTSGNPDIIYRAPSFFSATRSSSFSGGSLNGSYDPFTHTVRIWLWCTATANVAASVALFTGIPEEYRPSVAVSGAAFCVSGAPSYYPYTIVIQPTGTVTQGSTNAFRGCFGYAEYTI